MLLILISAVITQDTSSDEEVDVEDEDILLVDEEEMVVAEIHAFRPVFKYRGLRARKT